MIGDLNSVCFQIVSSKLSIFFFFKMVMESTLKLIFQKCSCGCVDCLFSICEDFVRS